MKSQPRRGPGPGRFKKGQSGNPKGRPRLPADVRLAYAALHPEALEVLNKLLHSRSPRVALKAAEIVIERVEGKPRQNIEVNATGSISVAVVDPYAQPLPEAAQTSAESPGAEVASIAPAPALPDPLYTDPPKLSDWSRKRTA